MTHLARWAAPRSQGHLRLGTASVSLALSPTKGEGLPARGLLDWEWGVASTRVCRRRGPRALGRGLEGVRACACRPRGQTLPATVYEGPPCPPLLTAGVPRGFGGRLPSVPAPAGHPQAHLRLSGSVGLTARPALPSAPLPRPSSSSTSRAPARPGLPPGNGFGDEAKQHLGDRCAQAGPGLPWPCPTPLLPPVSPFVTGHRWASRPGRHPFMPGPQAGHRER